MFGPYRCAWAAATVDAPPSATAPQRGPADRGGGSGPRAPTLRLRLTGWQIPLELEVVRPCQSRPRSTCSPHRAGACVGLPCPTCTRAHASSPEPVRGAVNCKWWKLQLATQATCALWMARCHLCTANGPGTKALVPSCCCKWCKATCTLWVARCHLCTAANCPGTRALGTHGPLDPAAPEGNAGAAREGQ